MLLTNFTLVQKLLPVNEQFESSINFTRDILLVIIIMEQ